MWYFAWVLGLGLACAFAILNAMWYEIRAQDNAEQGVPDGGSSSETPDTLA
jgi:cyd operon protein YbgT